MTLTRQAYLDRRTKEIEEVDEKLWACGDALRHGDIRRAVELTQDALMSLVALAAMDAAMAPGDDGQTAEHAAGAKAEREHILASVLEQAKAHPEHQDTLRSVIEIIAGGTKE